MVVLGAGPQEVARLVHHIHRELLPEDADPGALILSFQVGHHLLGDQLHGRRVQGLVRFHTGLDLGGDLVLELEVHVGVLDEDAADLVAFLLVLLHG